MPIDITKKPFIQPKTFAQRLKPELRQQLGRTVRLAHLAVAHDQGIDTSEEDKLEWGEDLDIGVRLNCINIGTLVFDQIAEWLDTFYAGQDVLMPLLSQDTPLPDIASGDEASTAQATQLAEEENERELAGAEEWS